MKKLKVSRPKKDPNVYPPGLNLAKTKAIANYYDARKNQSIAESGSIARSEMAVWMEVPPDLVDEVKKLIARRRKTA